jgi:hypothetical protein
MNRPLNRRNLMKSLFAAPALAGLEGCCKLCPPSAQATVNVVLHGAYMLDLNQKLAKAFVRIPEVAGINPHVYKIGHWLKEEDLQDTQSGKPIRIGNLVGSSRLPNISDLGSNDAVVKTSLTVAKQPKIEIELPMPKSIILARNAKLIDPDNAEPAPFFEKTDLVTQPNQVPLTVVLVYAMDISSQLPVVEQYHWSPAINLHIYAEPKNDPIGSHTLDAFHAVRSMYKELSGLNLNHEWCDPTNGCDNNYERETNTNTPPGLSDYEIKSLAEREQMVNCHDDNSPPVSTGGHHAGTCLHLINISS